MLRKTLFASSPTHAHHVLRTHATRELWTIRQKLVAENKARHEKGVIAPLVAKPVSSVTFTIPLATDEAARAHYVSTAVGGGLRVGKLLEDLDSFACQVAWVHSAAPTATANAPSAAAPAADAPINAVRNIVTGRVERIDTLDETLSEKEDIVLDGRVVFVSRATMSVRVLLRQRSSSHDAAVTKMMADFSLVSVGPDGKPTSTNPLIVPTKADLLAAYREAERNHEATRAARAERKRLGSDFAVDLALLSRNVDAVQRFSSEASRNSGDTLSMMSTRRVATHITQRQDANSAGNMFGGAVMQRAYEIAWVAALCVGRRRPAVLVQDDIEFLRPIPLGSVCIFTATVSHTRGRLVAVHVACDYIDPQAATSGVLTRSNTFDFIFAADCAATLAIDRNNMEELVLACRGMQVVDDAIALGKSRPEMAINKYNDN